MSFLSRMSGTLARAGRRVYVEEKLAAFAFAVLLVSLSAQAIMAHDFKAGSLTIDHPWTRATPQGASVGAGYVVIKNAGATPDRLVAATFEGAQSVEIHEMAMANGIMTMRPLPDGLVVPANGQVELKPGSFHLMFMKLKQPLQQGTSVAGTLTFEKAGTVAVQFAVDAIAAQGGGHDHGSK